MSTVLYNNFNFNKKNVNNKSANISLALKLIHKRNIIMQENLNRIKKTHNTLQHKEEHKEANLKNKLNTHLVNSDSSLSINHDFIQFV